MFKILKSTFPCRYCDMAQALLVARDLPYEVEVREGARLKEQGFKTVPQIWHDTTHIGGFSDLEAYVDKITQPEQRCAIK